MSDAARILREYYSYFVNFEEQEEEPELEEIGEKKKKSELDHRSIEELELSVRTCNCLKIENIKTLGELREKTDKELIRIKNLGQKSLDEIRQKLESLDI